MTTRLYLRSVAVEDSATGATLFSAGTCADADYKARDKLREGLETWLNGNAVMKRTFRSVAIIATNGDAPKAYPVGKEVAPGVTVQDVQPRYVTLLDGGVQKRLDLLPDAGVSSTTAAQPTATRTAMPAVLWPLLFGNFVIGAGLQGVAALRNQYAADLVMMLIHPASPSACGIAYVQNIVSTEVAGFAAADIDVDEGRGEVLILGKLPGDRHIRCGAYDLASDIGQYVFDSFALIFRYYFHCFRHDA